MNKTKYMQTDGRWGSLGYPRAPYCLNNCGCGEVSIANCIIEMSKYRAYTPATIQPYCKQYADPSGAGTYWSGIPAMMKHYGMSEVKEHATMPQLWAELAKGNRVAIYLMGSRGGGNKGVHWTSSGHFVCSVDYKYEGGKHWVYVKDSYSNSSLRNGFISYEDNMRGDVLKVWSGKLPDKPKRKAPTTPYTGRLPATSVKKGSRGTDVKHLQTFLNWRFSNYEDLQKLDVDGICGDKTVSAINRFKKLYAKKYGLKPNGVFGKSSIRVAQKVVDAYAKKYTPPTPQDKMCAWAKKIADEKYHYVKWKEGVAKTHTCPICTGRKYDDYYGGNCIWFAWASWHHGAGLPSRCSCSVFTDYHYNKLLEVSYTEASSLAKQRIGIDNVYLMRSYTGFDIKDLKAGDVIAYFTKGGYVHTALCVGNGKIADCTSSRSDGIMYGVNSYTQWKIKLVFRYTGK